MRHLNRGRKLNRTASHRRAMIRNLVTSLFRHGRVFTTPAKAKEARPFAEKLITLAKKGTLHARRRAIQLLHDKKVVANLFSTIGPRYLQRPGGYCRILLTDRRCIGDGAPKALFELVESEMPTRKKKSSKTLPVAPKVESNASSPADASTGETTSSPTPEGQAEPRKEGDSQASPS